MGEPPALWDPTEAAKPQLTWIVGAQDLFSGKKHHCKFGISKMVWMNTHRACEICRPKNGQGCGVCPSSLAATIHRVFHGKTSLILLE